MVEKKGKPVVIITQPRKRIIKKTKKVSGNEFLAKLAGYKIENLPKDLAENLDKYAWE